MSRAESLRTLARFNVQRRYGRDGSGNIDWNQPVSFTVRPRGFQTVLMVVAKPEATHIEDFVSLMDAVANLADMAPPPIRKRRRKAKA